GFLALPWSPGESILERVRELQGSIDITRAWKRGGSPADPWYLPDQDSWNAVLASTADGGLVALEHQLAPAPGFPGVTLHDRETLDCRYDDGRRPYLLHHWKHKPWLR